jgi:hypothetical protein
MDPKPFICAHDLKGREIDVQIDRVIPGEIKGVTGGKPSTSKKPACYFRDTRDKRPLFLNITNCKTLAALTGSTNIEDWAGQWVTLYPTTTRSASGETVDCIRIKNRAPKPRNERQQRGGQNEQPQTRAAESTNQDPDPQNDGGREPGVD